MNTSFSRTRILTTTLVSAVVLSAGVASAHGKGACGHDMFEKADTNNDGQITRAESKQVADARFQEFDTDGDGSITQEEAKAAMEAKRAAWAKKRAERGDDAKDGKRGDRPHAGKHKNGGEGHGKHGGFFARLDTNGDGAIARSEAEAFETEHFNRMDTNGDGVITQAEVEAKRAAMKAKWQEKRAQRGQDKK